MKNLVALLCGVIFSVGLTISGMVNPQKVLNFLDISGRWDPSLAFVMAGALLVFGGGYWLLIARSAKPALDKCYQIPQKTTLDKPLVVGAILFGVGWGVTGICPGPAIANLTGGQGLIFIFIAAMIAGMFIAGRVKSQRT